jgi:hypothetical protein
LPVVALSFAPPAANNAPSGAPKRTCTAVTLIVSVATSPLSVVMPNPLLSQVNGFSNWL